MGEVMRMWNVYLQKGKYVTFIH